MAISGPPTIQADKPPTQFVCACDGKSRYLKDFPAHMAEVHAGFDQPVTLRSVYCCHGNPVDADWKFCCDYDPW